MFGLLLLVVAWMDDLRYGCGFRGVLVCGLTLYWWVWIVYCRFVD